MSQISEAFLRPIDTLRRAKAALDEELDGGPGRSPLDASGLDRVWDLSDRHAAAARGLQDLMAQFGADEVLHYEVELLCAEFEGVKGEVERRMLAPREVEPSPPAPSPRRSLPPPPAVGRERGPDEDLSLLPKGGVRVFHHDVRYPVRIMAVEPEGARLRHDGRLPADAWVAIRYRHLSIRARVVWSDDVSASLQFRARLGPADLKALQATAPVQPAG